MSGAWLALLAFSGVFRGQSWWLADTTLRQWGELTVSQEIPGGEASGVFRVYESPAAVYGVSFTGLHRLSVHLEGGFGILTLGDIEQPWGLGLLFFPVYEPETQREQFLRGVDWRTPDHRLRLLVGQPRKWTYFSPEFDPEDRLGLVMLGGEAFGVAVEVLRNTRRRTERRTAAATFSTTWHALTLEGEGLWGWGYDPLLLQDTTGFGLYGRATWGFGGQALRLEGKWYEGLDLTLAYPPPANRLGVLPSNGRSEAGVWLAWEGGWQGWVYTLSSALGWDPWKPDSLNYREAALDLMGSRGSYGWRIQALAYRWSDALRVIGKTFREEVRLQLELQHGDWILSGGPRSVNDGHPWRETLLALSVSPRPWKLETALLLGDSLSGWVALSYQPPQPWTVALRVGRVRGDLVCAGGVCRFEPPFRGVDFSLDVQF